MCGIEFIVCIALYINNSGGAMDWMQVLFLFFANASLIIWFRAESRADWRHMDNKLNEMREDSRADMKLFETEVRSWREAIQIESKDFHGRLCAIEEKKRK